MADIRAKGTGEFIVYENVPVQRAGVRTF